MATVEHSFQRSKEMFDGAQRVNIASVGGQVGLRQRAAYCASKGALIGLTKAMAVDHAEEGIRVNCICPGIIRTPWVQRMLAESGEPMVAVLAIAGSGGDDDGGSTAAQSDGDGGRSSCSRCGS